jgi:hypothetical protein
VWDWPATAFQEALGRHALPFAHGLSGLPGFDREAVVELAGRVPPSWTRPHSGRQPLVFPDKVRVADTSAAEMARTIADSGNRLIIYYLERIEPYRTLMRRSLEELTAVVGRREGGTCATSLNVFLASPGGVIRSHFDRHHNLLLQLEGRKEITVGTYEDPDEDQRVIERARRRDHNNLSELPTRTRTFVLGPGDGLYIPPYAFHWVQGSSDVSVALSYGFATAATTRAPLVYWCNANLRRLGFRPRPPGQSERLDQVKTYAITRAARLHHRLRRRGGPA